MERDLVLRDCRLPDGRLVDLSLSGATIAAVEWPGKLPRASLEVVVKGRLVTPGLADPHLHPDKAFALDGADGVAGTPADAIAEIRAGKPLVTADAVRVRTLLLMRQCLSFGTTRARVHAEVDPLLQLRSVEGVLEAREQLRGTMQIEVVAFPQEGILREPGTLDLMREAMIMGCDVVGAISYQDPDPREHLALAAGLARELGRPLDVHADFGIAPERSALGILADVTEEFGLSGMVTAGHCTTLARMDASTRLGTAGRLRTAGISVVALPRTDLFLDGVVAPLEELRALGLRCHVATNNIRNAFTPVGRPSLPSAAAVYALAARVGSKTALGTLAASLWQWPGGGGEPDIAPGGRSDLCVWPVPEPWRLVADEPEPDIFISAAAPVVQRGSEAGACR
jgi:cytosine/creatinine deaminase